MVRRLAIDELAWFLCEALRYAGHRDPGALARDLAARLREPRRDAERCWVDLALEGTPASGAVVHPPAPDDDARVLRLGSLWTTGGLDGARRFVGTLLASVPHDAVVVDVSHVDAERRALLGTWLDPLGFRTRSFKRMEFALVDTPPLGVPYALEAWTPDNDGDFRRTVEAAEGRPVSDARWSWQKRKGGAFRPDTWFVHRVTPDQDPIGFALCHGDGDLDGAHVIEAAGVVASERGSTEAVRRLLLTTLLELSSISPWGSASIEADASDPKWEEILARIGFVIADERTVLERQPA